MGTRLSLQMHRQCRLPIERAWIEAAMGEMFKGGRAGSQQHMTQL